MLDFAGMWQPKRDFLRLASALPLDGTGIDTHPLLG
ncbi:MAG: hypothetical protein IMHGJWDQ_000243 [Candidatus Fervidibacter sp.]